MNPNFIPIITGSAWTRCRTSNYNQVAKAVHSGELTEKKALALLYKLEQLTVEYISLNKEIIRLTKEFERWLQR